MSKVSTRPQKAATPRAKRARPASSSTSAEADFARGRDTAISMINEGAALCGERDCFRRDREPGTAQDNFVNGYLSDVIDEPKLRAGFTAVLSQIVGASESFDSSYFKDLTLAETMAGVDRAQSDTESADVPHELSQARAPVPTAKGGLPAPDAEIEEMVAYDAMLEAVAVLRAAEYAAACSTDMYWGLISFAEQCADHVDRAQAAFEAKGFSLSLHEEASAQLAGLLGVLYAVNKDDVLLQAATRLVTIAKSQIDQGVDKACEVKQ